MATSVEAGIERYDVRTVVRGGVVLGVATAVGVAIFALLSRPMDGTVESVVQSILILAGGAVFAYYPAAVVRPRSAEPIAWAATLGFLGAIVFTFLDTALLRPLDIYHWTWDQIGGGSGFWYIPIWWMGSAVLAWLGSWVYARTSASSGTTNLSAVIGVTLGIAVVLTAMLVVTGLAPFHAATVALAVSLALVVHVPLAGVLARR